MIQDLSGSWCIKGTGESTLIMDSTVPLMHRDPDRSWITDLDPDHPKGTHPKLFSFSSVSARASLVSSPYSCYGILSHRRMKSISCRFVFIVQIVNRILMESESKNDNYFLLQMFY